MKKNLMLMAIAVTALACALSAKAQVPVTGVGGASLKQIAGSATLVTVVLKGTNAEDTNLKIESLSPNTFSAVTEEGKRVVYLYSSVAEVRVQGGIVAKPKLPSVEDEPLSDEEQQIVTRAIARTEEIFNAANNDQELKIRSAFLLGLQKHEEALKYLHQLQQSNDLETQLDASLALWLTGEATPEQLLKDGLRSGSREVRAEAAMLSGVNNYQDGIPMLYQMLQDRVAEISGPSAEALARLKDREIIPSLIELLKKPNEEKRDSAIFAFSRLGGEDIITQMKALAKVSDGQLLFSITKVLYNLGDPQGKELLINAFETIPTLEPDAALILGREGYPDAIQFLRTRLERREDPTEYNLWYRAQNAASLIASGEPSKKAIFQELLRGDKLKTVSLVLELIIQNGDRDLMSLTKPVIEHKNPKIAVGACEAAISLADSSFRTNLLEILPRVRTRPKLETGAVK